MNKTANLRLKYVLLIIFLFGILCVGLFLLRSFGPDDDIYVDFNSIDYPKYNQSLNIIDMNPEIKSGDSEILSIRLFLDSFKSEYEEGVNAKIVIESCVSDMVNPDCNSSSPIFVSSPKTVSVGETLFESVLTAKCSVDYSKKLMPGYYICSIKVVTVQEPIETIAQSQVTIEITK